MTNVKHTPAPWAILDLKEIRRIYVSGGDIICDVRGEQQQANARLIAAAPELLEAVERLIPAAEDDSFQYGCDPETDEDVLFARAAIAKVRGEVL